MEGVKPATELQKQSGRDGHSVETDALFVNPAAGDYRVREGSPALRLGFQNFPMDQFGVQWPKLKRIARTPNCRVWKRHNRRHYNRAAIRVHPSGAVPP